MIKTELEKLIGKEITTRQMVALAILCAKRVYHFERWETWAINWFSGSDRTGWSALRAGTILKSGRGTRAAGASTVAAWCMSEGYIYKALHHAEVAIVYAVEISKSTPGYVKQLNLAKLAKEAMKY